MESINKIDLYKRRSLSDKINATFSFLGQNAGPYFKAQLFITGPVVLLATIVHIVLIGTFFQNLDFANESEVLNNAFQTFEMSILNSTLSLIVSIMITLVHLSYMKRYSQQANQAPAVIDVWHECSRHLLKAFGFGIIAGLLIMIGFLFLLIPGVYLAVVLSVGLPVLVMEDSSVVASMDRSYKLIKGKWWSTFGLIFLMSIIGAIIAFVVQLPATALVAGETLFSIQEGENLFEEPGLGFSTFTIGLSAFLTYLGNAFSMILLIGGVAFQYFNLVELKESRGLMEEIGRLGDRDGANTANEGEY